MYCDVHWPCLKCSAQVTYWDAIVIWTINELVRFAEQANLS